MQIFDVGDTQVTSLVISRVKVLLFEVAPVADAVTANEYVAATYSLGAIPEILLLPIVIFVPVTVLPVIPCGGLSGPSLVLTNEYVIDSLLLADASIVLLILSPAPAVPSDEAVVNVMDAPLASVTSGKSIEVEIELFAATPVSCTLTVIELAPVGASGVPEISPVVVFKSKPDGKFPVATVHDCVPGASLRKSYKLIDVIGLLTCKVPGSPVTAFHET